jgi:hypothetical protein
VAIQNFDAVEKKPLIYLRPVADVADDRETG